MSRFFFEKFDWKRYSLPIGVFCLAIVFLVFSIRHYVMSADRVKQSKMDITSQRQINQAGEKSFQTLLSFHGVYQEYQRNGFIGDAQRLKWIEALVKVGNVYLIPRVEFTLAPEKISQQFDSIYFKEDVVLRTTDMILYMDMMHEGDLYIVLDYLETYAPGLFSVEKCHMFSVSVDENKPVSPHAKAECRLQWYTAQDISLAWDHGEREKLYAQF